MWFTKESDGFRAWFTVQDKNGNLRTGIVGGEFTVAVVDPADTASLAPAVTESATKAGLYTFLVTSTFLGTNGNGSYGIVVEIDVPAAPKVTASFGQVLEVYDHDFDSIPAAVWAEIIDGTMDAGTAMKYLLSMAHGAFTETMISPVVKDFAFTDRAGAALFTLRITQSTGRTRTSG